MKFIKFLLPFIYLAASSQNQIKTKLVKTAPLEAQSIIRIDEFGTQYFYDNTTFYSKGTHGNLEYSNIQLGNISSVDTFNPLKINVFYENFNTVILLDNRLAEIKKIDFNLISPYRDVSHISSAYDNDIWIFNVNTQQLELFNYKDNKTKFKTLPINGHILGLTSNYNYCWLMTSENIYTYNYAGVLISKINNDGFEAINNQGENLFLLKDNQLFLKAENQDEIKEIKTPQLLISQFFVTNETLYIYDGKNLNHYQLIND